MMSMAGLRTQCIAMLTGLCLALAMGRALRAQPGIGLGRVEMLSTQISARPWTVEQGLPQSSVTELTVDRAGYIWGATFGGLFRFDGRTVVSLTAKDIAVLTTNAVAALYPAPDGTLWFGTPAGTIGRLRNGRLVDTMPTVVRGARGVAIDNIDVEPGGDIWVKSGELVHHFRQGQWDASPLPHESWGPLVRDNQGRLVFFGPTGLFRVERDGVLHKLANPPTPRGGRELGLHVDAHDRIWIGEQNGLWLFDAGVLRTVATVPGAVLAITSDRSGTIWFSANDVLYRLPTTARAGVVSTAEPMLDANVFIAALRVTPDGLLVVGTLEGLLVVRENAVSVLESPRTGATREAASMVASPHGDVWLTSDCSTALRLAANGSPQDSFPRVADAGCIRSLAIDEAGRLWAGGDGVVWRRDTNGGERQWRLPPVTPEVSVVRPLLIVGDTLFFGVNDGRIGRIDPDNVLRFAPLWRVPIDVPIHALARAPDGALWVGQTGMLTRWAGDQLTHYHAAHGIPNAVPRTLLVEADSGVWIGTYGNGLAYFRPGARARAVPLRDETVSAFMLDNRMRLWMPGNRGLSVVPMASLRRWAADSSYHPDVRLFSAVDGVPEGNLGYPAAVRLPGEMLGFASVNGLVRVHTSTVTIGAPTPPLTLDVLRTADHIVQPIAGRVTLPPDQRLLHVTFSTPTYRFADEVLFRYRLNGRDREWIVLDNNREFRLTALRPGTYTLQVEGRVPGGDWRAAAPVTVDVRPLFLERMWPRVMAVLLALAVGAFIVWQRVRTLEATARARDVELQARHTAAVTAEEHQRELARVSRVAVAGELTASLSHELGQPLAAMVNNAEVARRLLVRAAAPGTTPDPQVEQALRDVVAQGQRASQVVREFRRFLTREQGERDFLSVRELLESTTVLLRREFADARVTLDVRLMPDAPPIMAERVLLQQVLVNLLQNALESAHLPGVVLLRARRSGAGVRISVVDNGAGFAESVRRTAFEPFVSTRSGGMGMGLAIARRVVEAHGGRIAISRLPGAGAVVSLWLPSRPTPVSRSAGPVSSNRTTTHG